MDPPAGMKGIPAAARKPMVSLPPPHRRRRQTSLRGMRAPRLAGDSQNAGASEAAPNHGARPKAVQRDFFLQANGLDWLAMAPKAKARQIILLREQIAVSVLRYCLPAEPMTGRSAIGRRTKREIRVRMISG